jgi:hypothetical protein
VAAVGRTGWLSWRADPNNFVTSLAGELRASGVRDAYAGYWLAYALGFVSGGAITVSPPDDSDRYLPYLRAVEASPDPAWLFAEPGRAKLLAIELRNPVLEPGCAHAHDRCLLAGAFERWLSVHGVPYRKLRLGSFIVVVPERGVPPRQVLEELHAGGR